MGPEISFAQNEIDEAGHAVVEYKDKDGLVILKKVQIGTVPTDFSGYVGWLSTYYIYDNLNQLRFVLSPKATKIAYANTWTLSTDTTAINELCFRYEYDGRERMIAGDYMPRSGRAKGVISKGLVGVPRFLNEFDFYDSMDDAENDPVVTEVFRPDGMGYAAGFMIVTSILLLAGIGALIGLVVGAVAPLALAGAPVGLVLGFYAVWIRFFKRA